METYVDKKAPWLKWIVPEDFYDYDLFRIVTFFVFHSPCKSLSSMGKSLEEYGWHTPWKKPYHLNKQLKQASTNFNLIFSANSCKNLSLALEKANLADPFPTEIDKERIAIVNNKKNQFISVFYHLRNAFAHCRINMVTVNNECTFILEDIVNKNDSQKCKLSARMIIKKQTLLNWINIIENGEKEYVK